MKLLECKRCGSQELAEQSGFIVCLFCQSRYVPEADEVPAMETIIAVASDVQDLLTRCRQEPHNRRRYASLVLDIDPTNAEARHYLS